MITTETDPSTTLRAGSAKITEVRWLKQDQILIGESQPRKHFDKAGIDELVESFRQHGFSAGVSHLLVRPLGEYRIDHPKGSTHYFVQRRMNRDWETVDTADSEAESKAKMIDAELFELVCGERRLRASEILELKRVPAVIEEMDDLSVLKLQLIENLQRSSLTPLEEAMAFKRLRGMGQTAEDIAQTVSRPIKLVKERLALCRIIGTPVAAAVDAGEITPTHGAVLSRVPSVSLRNELLKKVLCPPDGSQPPWHSKALEAHIKLDYVINLRPAKFDQTDPTLVPVEFAAPNPSDGGDEPAERLYGGACTDCPFNVTPVDAEKRSSSRMCMNPECFRMKEMADYERWSVRETGNRKAENGEEIIALSHAENAELWNESGMSLSFHSPYVELNHPPEASELRGDAEGVGTWKVLIEGQAVPMVLGRDVAGRVHELVKHELAKRAAHLNGHLIFRDSAREQRVDSERSASAPGSGVTSEERSKAETLAEAARLRQAVAGKNAEIAAIVAAAEGKECRGQFRLPKAFYQQLLFTLLSVGESFEVGGSETTLTQAVMEGRGLELSADLLRSLTIGEQFGLAVEMLIALDDEQRESWGAVFGVKLEAVRKAAERRLRISDPPKADGKRKEPPSQKAPAAKEKA